MEISELQLGDKISLGDWPYGTATVHEIRDGVVHALRVYVHTSDVKYTGGVIAYIGTEEVKLSVDDSRKVIFLEHGPKLRRK